MPTAPTNDIATLASAHTDPVDTDGALIGSDGYGYVSEFPIQCGAMAGVAQYIVDVYGVMVKSDDASVTGVIALTQAEYDALTPDAATLYVITG